MASIKYSNLPFTLMITSLLAAALPIQGFAQDNSNSAEFGINSSTGQQAPPTPTGLYLQHKIKSTTLLLWQNSVAGNASEYLVYRLENYDPNGTLKVIATVPRNRATPPVARYEDKTIQPGHTYTYFLVAKNPYGLKSGNSAMVSTRTADKF